MGDWIHYITEGGQPFYYNDKNGEFQWEPPDGLPGAKLIAKKSNPSAVEAGLPGEAGKSSNQASKSSEMLQMTSAVNVPAVVDTFNSSASELPVGEEHADEYEWHPYKDADTGALFWYNHITGVSQWECPYDPPAGTEAQAEGDNGYYDEHDHDHDGEEHEAQVVHDTDDLGI